MGIVGVPANVLEAPAEGLHAAIVVGGPAAVLVAADAAFEPVHRKKSPLYSLQITDGPSKEAGSKCMGIAGCKRPGPKKEFNTEAAESAEGEKQQVPSGKSALHVRHPTPGWGGSFETGGYLWHIRDVVIAFFFLFGIVMGSFLNVCITRIPEGLSIVTPGSRCPRCQTAIKAYDNVPLFAWLWLRGKCRSCGLAISPMYPLVELLTGLLFVAGYLDFGLTQTAVKWLFFTCLIIVLTITDLRVRLLPDLVNWPGFAVGLFFSALVPPQDGMMFWIRDRMPPR